MSSGSKEWRSEPARRSRHRCPIGAARVARGRPLSRDTPVRLGRRIREPDDRGGSEREGSLDLHGVTPRSRSRSTGTATCCRGTSARLRACSTSTSGDPMSTKRNESEEVNPLNEGTTANYDAATSREVKGWTALLAAAKTPEELADAVWKLRALGPSGAQLREALLAPLLVEAEQESQSDQEVFLLMTEWSGSGSPRPVASRCAELTGWLGARYLRDSRRFSQANVSGLERKFDHAARVGRPRPRSPQPAKSGSTERRRSRTDRAVGYTTARVLKTRWTTGPMPLRWAG